MAFKKKAQRAQVTDTPDQLFLDLPRRKIPGVLPHQRDVMRAFATGLENEPDVALQLPTGSGKTLVGLLIAEWIRRKDQARVVYLCPTRQLVNQVVEQAEDKYGMSVLGFTGSKRAYAPIAKAQYRNAEQVAVTTYSSLFNTNPYFNDADVLILDDAHVAENYVASNWSLQVERGKVEHQAIHAALATVLQRVVDPADFVLLVGEQDAQHGREWVDKLPTLVFDSLHPEIIEILDTHCAGTELEYPWQMLRSQLHGCHLYMSSKDILIRPLIPPTWSHGPFSNPKQRIYMSATLGRGGDLERLMGRRRITRLPVPDGWDRQGVGRRFFLFPNMSLTDADALHFKRGLMQRVPRSIALVPSGPVAGKTSAEIQAGIGYQTISAKDIEASKSLFVNSKKTVAVIANRYDGIDFPGDECRLLFIEGLPKATNTQERFLMSRMGANVLFNERVQTRVMQSIGRCTRSLEDYSAVVISGEELTDYLADTRRRQHLHPEIQAEIEFGVDQSMDTSMHDMVDNFDIFIRNGTEWEEVNQDIVEGRKRAKQVPFPAIDDLTEAVFNEVMFHESLWEGDYLEALGHAEQVLGSLKDPELKGYRALWHYLAGSVAWKGEQEGQSMSVGKAQLHFSSAKKSTLGVRWLVNLTKVNGIETVAGEEDPLVLEQIEGIENILARLGRSHNRKYAKFEKTILDGVTASDAGLFEEGQKKLGEIVGFKAGNIETDGAPDPWWLIGDRCFVFEDHSDAKMGSALAVQKARQVASHPNWIRQNVHGCKESIIKAVLVTPVKKVKKGAVPHLQDVALWPIGDFRSWAQAALTVIRQLRVSFMEPGDLNWRADAVCLLKEAGVDAVSLVKLFESQLARDMLETID